MFGKAVAENHVIFDSTIPSKPSFTFGKKHSFKRVVNPIASSDFLGRESPGVGYYNYEKLFSFTHNQSHHKPAITQKFTRYKDKE
jgi:hypothetical protein